MRKSVMNRGKRIIRPLYLRGGVERKRILGQLSYDLYVVSLECSVRGKKSGGWRPGGSERQPPCRNTHQTPAVAATMRPDFMAARRA